MIKIPPHKNQKQNLSPKSSPHCLTISNLHRGYTSGEFTISEVIELVLSRSQKIEDAAAWITRASDESLFAQAKNQQEFLKNNPEALSLKPLLGVPFAVKDNIDVAGFPTTAACLQGITYPTVNSTVTSQLLAAGAICIGKTNMDQLATGLVGTRSPYGDCRNPFNPDYITGGSSSGSALAVARGMVSFALGTDTAGSGRVPAAFCNLVGYKPTRGLISNKGVIPACPSLDCVSIFALTAEDVTSVLPSCAGYDSQDAYSRNPLQFIAKKINSFWNGLRLGMAKDSQLDFSNDSQAEDAFFKARKYAQELGANCIEVNIAPLLEAVALLYQGPWIAERYEAISRRIDPDSESLLPVTRKVLAAAKNVTGISAFKSFNRLMELKRECENLFSQIDVLFLPTAPTHFTQAEIAAEPIQLNFILGRYTNFVNLLDLSAVALPSVFRDDGLPFGITLMAPAFCDVAILELGNYWQQKLSGKNPSQNQPFLPLGAGGWNLSN